MDLQLNFNINLKIQNYLENSLATLKEQERILIQQEMEFFPSAASS